MMMKKRIRTLDLVSKIRKVLLGVVWCDLRALVLSVSLFIRAQPSLLRSRPQLAAYKQT